MRLDFSEFHPLDHTIWECRGYPGGRRRHLSYRWQFQWRDRVRRYTRCPFGRHWFNPWYDNHGKVVAVACQYCCLRANRAQWNAATVDARERHKGDRRPFPPRWD